MARRSISTKQPAKNIGAAPPIRRTMGPNGVMVTEKVNPIPFNQKMVSPDGDVVSVSLANGFTIRGFKGNDYGVQKLEEKLAAGFLPYSECPLATGRVPVAKGAKPCRDEEGRPAKFSDAKCCPHMDAIMQERREHYRSEKAPMYKAHESSADRLIQAMEAQMKKAQEAVTEVQVSGKKGLSGG
jgi:hypothetical protein